MENTGALNGNEAMMKCPFLIIPVAAICVAQKKADSPSPAQLDGYCKGKDYGECLIFRETLRERYGTARGMMNNLDLSWFPSTE
jgi:hypothetical protein